MADITGMLQAAAGVSGEEADEDFANTVLLLHGDGTNGAQNNTFIDSSTNNFTITRNGNTTQGSFSPFSKPDGRWGNYFDGSGDYLTLADNAAFDVGSGDFTVEYWFYWTGTGQQRHYGQADSGGSVASISILSGTTSTNKLISRAAVGGSLTDCTSTADLPANSFVHIAFVRDGTTLRQYINGVQDGTASISTSTINNSANQFSIGRTGEVNADYTSGYISNFRFVKGTCLYPSGTAFTPSTTPLTAIANTSLLICQSNRFIDNSTNNFAITRNGDVKVTPFSPFPITTAYDPSVNGGAGYVGGASTYLALPSSTPLSLDSTQYEVECWIYPTSWVNGQGIWGASNGGGAQPKVACQISDSSTTINLFVDGAVKLTATVPALNQWTHLLISRATSGTGYLYYNGILQDSDTVPTTAVTSAFQWFTNGEGGTSGMYGYMAGAKVSNVASKTGSNFTIPSAPPTVDANTEFLCNFTNAGILDNTGFNALETVGNAQIDTTTKKYGTGSIEFDGTGDNLTIASNPSVWLGSGAFTIEMWLYPNDAASEQMLVAGSDTGSLFLGMNIDGANRIALGRKGVAVDNQVSYTYSTGAWIHLACVRDSSNNIYFFVDGTQVGSTGTNSNSFTNSTLNIGFEPTQKYFNGYIDDLRITKGVARYTTTFTPPTKAFPDIGS